MVGSLEALAQRLDLVWIDDFDSCFDEDLDCGLLDRDDTSFSICPRRRTPAGLSNPQIGTFETGGWGLRLASHGHTTPEALHHHTPRSTVRTLPNSRLPTQPTTWWRPATDPATDPTVPNYSQPPPSPSPPSPPCPRPHQPPTPLAPPPLPPSPYPRAKYCCGVGAGRGAKPGGTADAYGAYRVVVSPGEGAWRKEDLSVSPLPLRGSAAHRPPRTDVPTRPRGWPSCHRAATTLEPHPPRRAEDRHARPRGWLSLHRVATSHSPLSLSPPAVPPVRSAEPPCHRPNAPCSVAPREHARAARGPVQSSDRGSGNYGRRNVSREL